VSRSDKSTESEVISTAFWENGDPGRSAIATAINSLAGPAPANSTIEPQRLFPKRSSIDDANTLTSGVQLQYYTAAQKATGGDLIPASIATPFGASLRHILDQWRA